MAFKKNPDAESFGGPAEMFGLNEVQFDSVAQFIAVFWPAMLGGIALFILVVMGRERMAMAIAAIMVTLQAWLLGLLR